MNKKYIYAAILLISSSCMKNDDIIKDKLVSLAITPTVSIENTKALMDGTTITGQTVGIQVAKSDGSALYDNQSGYNNISMTNGTPWALGTQVYLSSNNAKIYAYCPYSATANDLSGVGEASTLLLNIPNSQVMANQKDYLYAAQGTTVKGGTDNINNTKPNVILTMNHALAQIAFVFYKDNFSGTGNLSGITILDATTSNLKIAKITDNDLRMSLSTGEITGGSAISGISFTGIGKTISRTSDPSAVNDPTTLKPLVDAWILVVPATISDPTKITFIFTIDSKDYSVKLTGTNLTWAKGNQYIYKVKLSGTAAIISSVTVTDWTSNFGAPVVIQ